MKNLLKLILAIPFLFLPLSVYAENGNLDLVGQPSLTSNSGYSLNIGTGGNDDLNFFVENALVVKYDAETVQELNSLYQLFGTTTALDADVTTATTLIPFAAIVGSSGVRTHFALVQNVASAQGAELMALKTRAAAGSTNANTIISSGDDILKITAMGANGASYDPAAQILMESGGTPGASADMPGQIRLLVSADGSATLTEALKVGPTGLVTAANGVTVTTGDAILTSGDLSLVASGKTIEYETGTAASACAGTSTLNGTTAVTISTTCAVTGSLIFVSRTSDGSGNAANDQVGPWATNIQTGTSFDIDSSDANDSATVVWLILHEAP